MVVLINAENLRQDKIRFSLIVELLLTFKSSPNMVREVKNMSPSFTKIASRSFTVSYSLMEIVKPTLSQRGQSLINFAYS